MATRKAAKPKLNSAQKMVRDFYAQKHVFRNPFQENEGVIQWKDGKAVGIILYEAHGGVHLGSIRALRRGGGRRGMEDLTAMADKYGVRISGFAVPQEATVGGGKKLSKKRLLQFYRGFGFSDKGGDYITREPASLAKSYAEQKAANKKAKTKTGGVKVRSVKGKIKGEGTGSARRKMTKAGRNARRGTATTQGETMATRKKAKSAAQKAAETRARNKKAQAKARQERSGARSTRRAERRKAISKATKGIAGSYDYSKMTDRELKAYADDMQMTAQRKNAVEKRSGAREGAMAVDAQRAYNRRVTRAGKGGELYDLAKNKTRVGVSDQ